MEIYQHVIRPYLIREARAACSWKAWRSAGVVALDAAIIAMQPFCVVFTITDMLSTGRAHIVPLLCIALNSCLFGLLIATHALTAIYLRRCERFKEEALRILQSVGEEIRDGPHN